MKRHILSLWLLLLCLHFFHTQWSCTQVSDHRRSEESHSLDASIREGSPDKFVSEPDRPTETRPEQIQRTETPQDAQPREEERCNEAFIACKPYPVRFVWSRPSKTLLHNNEYAYTGINSATSTAQGFLFQTQTWSHRPGTAVEVKVFHVMHYDLDKKVLSFSKRLSGKVEDVVLLPLGSKYLQLTTRDKHHTPYYETKATLHSLKDGSLLPFQSPFSFLAEKETKLPVAYAPSKQIFVLQTPKALRAYDLEGKLLWQHNFNIKQTCTLLLDKDDNLYTCSGEGYILSLDIKGKKRWQIWGKEPDLYKEGLIPTGFLALGADGLLYANSTILHATDRRGYRGSIIRVFDREGKKKNDWHNNPSTIWNTPFKLGRTIKSMDSGIPE